jgi:OOP family OmpA-OmpF porin
MRKEAVIAVLAAAVMVLCVGQARAGEKSCAYSVTPYVGYHYYDNVRDLRDHPEAGLRAEKFLTDVWSVELGVGDVFTDSRTSGKSRDLTYSLNLTYNLFLKTQKLAPYLTAGLSGDYINNVALVGPDVGLGARWFITDKIALRPEARYIDLFTKKDEFLVLLGLNFMFGEKPKPAPISAPVEKKEAAPAPAPAPVPLDSDHDGVPDSLDKCPDTPAGVAVDKNGCPADSDGDGVPDYLDKCPDTPKGVAVDKNGCPPDSDGDGVPDYLDKCPDTPKGAKVDASGCPVKLSEKVSITLAIQFDTGKADINPRYEDQIKKVADFMKTYPETSVVIEGHTDNVGKEATNVKLSTKRAESVRNELIKKFGVAEKRVSAKGYGSSRPIADNATPEGRQKNRRIEAVIETTVVR